MSILVLVGSVLLLLVLIAGARLNAFIALILVSLATGAAKEMQPEAIVKSIQNGIGSTLGGLIIIIGMGIILGAILAETGAMQQIAESLILRFGVRRAKLALTAAAFTVGLALFYNAGFVVLIPLVFSVAASTGLSLPYLGLAAASALSVTHGFLPPHPGPTTIAIMFKANIGKTLGLGLCVAVPTLFCAGVVFPEFIKNIRSAPPSGIVRVTRLKSGDLPPFILSILIALSPALLMEAAVLGDFLLPAGSPLLITLKFLGDPSISMIMAVALALVFLGVGCYPLNEARSRIGVLMDRSSESLGGGALIILVVAAGGAFKQVLTDSGIGKDVADLVGSSGFSPLFLGWLIATAVRVSVGSATLAGLTAAGIVQPLLAANPSVSPELMVLSIGAGSLMLSHVNDTGFWMFKEYFGLTVADTFRTWSAMETIVGIVGLGMVLLLNLVI